MTSGGRGDLDGDLVLLEQVNQSKRDVPALLCRDYRCKLNLRKDSCGAFKGLPGHFPALGACSKRDAGIVGDSLHLPRAGLGGDINLLADHIEPDRGRDLGSISLESC